MSRMSQTMNDPQRSKAKVAGSEMPSKGDFFRCNECGMGIQVTTECRCDNPEHVRFQCCGKEMEKAELASSSQSKRNDEARR